MAYVHKVGDDINTDLIIASKNKRDTYDPKLMAVHLLEDLDPDFYSRVKVGDVIVAGNNFGCGSSREHAAHVIKAAGISAVIAKSFARIFYRNAINIGLPLIEVDTDSIEEGDEVKINLSEGKLENLTKDEIKKFNQLPKAISEIFKEGGLVNYLKKYGEFKNS
ncbi:MAG: 3-isopropylmalate dehydratase small subunit [Bacillota bacterium]|nr:3-isopropylmalate dehydratase small subunit [Bacillota bacterium]